MGTNEKDFHYGNSLFNAVKSNLQDSPKTDYTSVGAWFLGPKGENEQLLEDLVKNSIQEHALFRSTHYKKDDPPYIDDDIKGSDGYKAAADTIESVRKSLTEKLHGSVPFFSQRYQAHMNWDTVLPANVGYITAMLYNQNNVATEGGPETSQLEKEVGLQLGSMLGFDISKTWGHITSCGTIANLEAMWATRNLKFYPLAVNETILAYPELANARTDLKVTVYEPEGLNGPQIVMVLKRKPLIECDLWQLLNLDCDEVLGLADRIMEICGVSTDDLNAMLAPFLLQNRGLFYYANRYPQITSVKVFVPATKHYSWPKSGTILGLGQDNIVNIAVDDNCRMDMADLEKQLLNCARNKIPVLAVVAVFGSTEEGVVDNLEGILALREKARKIDPSFNSINFNIHCDAAWGGYLRTMMIPAKETDAAASAADDSGFVDRIPLSRYAQKQYSLLGKADTITIDPHKAGFIPYPAGSLCYRNGALRYMITFNAAYIHSDTDIAMGIFGVEGSKPGAAPAAVWAAHQAIPLNANGYGQILGECTFTTKLYYCYWLTLADENADFRIETLIPLPEKIYSLDMKRVIAEGKDQILAFIKDNIIGKDNDTIAANLDAIALLQQVGADVLINSFVVNFKKDGQWNTDLTKLNALNQKLFDMFSITTPEQAQANDVDYIITLSQLDSENYRVPLKRICSDLGIKVPVNYTMNFIINTILQPWPSTHGFIKTIMQTFYAGIEKCIKEMNQPELVSMQADSTDDRVYSIPADASENPVRYYKLKNSYASYAPADQNGNSLFYWFFESRSPATVDTPLIIWLNGGPGASSLAGLFLENGPFTLQNDTTLTPNTMSWNDEAHMLFWDQPVGTGFSNMEPISYVDSELELAFQFVNALMYFYAKHPEYSKNPLYITGESYAGKYIPFISMEITNRNQSGRAQINLKGLAIGDGWMDPDSQTRDQIEYAYMLGLVDTVQKVTALNCYSKFHMDIQEGRMADAFKDGTAISDFLVNCGGGENIYDVRTWSDASILPLKTYLSSKIVKSCIHVPQDIEWAFADAAGPVSDHLINDMMASVTHEINALLNQKDKSGQPLYKMLFYTGNFDMSCGFTGTETILRAMNWDGQSQWKSLQRLVWYKDLDDQKKQTLGCIKSLKNLTQIEIPMSGHQVPMYQPVVANEMIYNWIFDREFKTYNPAE